MEDELEEYIQAGPYERTRERRDQRNGTYSRELGTSLGNIEDLPVPRTRKGYRSELFDRYKRRQAELDESICQMFVGGVSTEKVGQIIETLSGNPPSPSTLSRVFHTLESEFAEWKKRGLQARYQYVIADGTYFSVIYDGKGQKMPILAVIGIDLQGKREVLKNSILGDIPFYHLPITPETKSQQEAQIKQVVEETRAELVVLARYMQILSDDLTRYLSGRCINIHHSFLPGFKGGKPFCMGLIGGHTGNLLEELAEREGLSAHWTRTKNGTRTCIILVEDGKDATVINERGAEISTQECESFVNDVWEQAERVQFVCVSGSLPPRFLLDDFQSLLSGLVERKKSVWVDTSSAALSAALNVNGINVKVNADELGDVLGIEISNAEQAQKVSAYLRSKGADSVVVTMGKDGAILTSNGGVWFAKPPEIKIVSSVGSGDAFLGGLVFALELGHSLDTALRHGAAAGAANALQFGGGSLARERFENLIEMTKVIQIHQ